MELKFVSNKFNTRQGSLVVRKIKHKKASSISWWGFFKYTLSAFNLFQQSHQLMIHEEIPHPRTFIAILCSVWEQV